MTVVWLEILILLQFQLIAYAIIYKKASLVIELGKCLLAK